VATIDQRHLIDDLIARNGDPEPGDPANVHAVKVVEYQTYEGATVWGVVFNVETWDPHMLMRYEMPTDYVRNPRVIWRRA